MLSIVPSNFIYRCTKLCLYMYYLSLCHVYNGPYIEQAISIRSQLQWNGARYIWLTCSSSRSIPAKTVSCLIWVRSFNHFFCFFFSVLSLLWLRSFNHCWVRSFKTIFFLLQGLAGWDAGGRLCCSLVHPIGAHDWSGMVQLETQSSLSKSSACIAFINLRRC